MAVNIRIGTAFDPKGLKQAQTQFQKFGAGIKKGLRIAGIVAATAAAVGLVATRFAKMAEEAQTANNRLDQIAHSMGLFGNETRQVTDRLKAYADANKFIFGADDEVIKSTQAKLLTFKELGATADVAGGAFDRATQAAFDLAAAGFGSATTNAAQLGKALQDPIKGLTALTRSGVTFTEGEKNLIRTMVESGNTLQAQEMILAAIEAQVGGTAEATANASTKMEIGFNEMGEALGTAVLPLFESFANYIVEITPKVEAFFAGLTDPTTPMGEAWLGMMASIEEFARVFAEVSGSVNRDPFFKFLFDSIQMVVTGLGQLIWVAGDAGKTLGMLFSGDFAGAGAQVSTFFARYDRFVQDTYARIDAGAARMAAEAQRRFEAIGAGGAGGTGLVGGGGGGGGGGRSAAASSVPKLSGLPALIAEANRNSKQVTNAGIRQTKLGNAGLSKEVSAWIATSAKPAVAARQALARIAKNGEKAITNITKAYNKSSAGQAAAAQASAQASADAAAAHSAMVAAQEAAARAEAEALAERERIYQSFLDTVKNTFAGIKTSILGAFDLTQLGGSTNAITRNMDKLLAKLRTFATNVRNLAGMGLDPALLQQVISAGPVAGARLASALVSGGAGALANLNRGYAEFGDLAGQIATTGTESLFNRPSQQTIYNVNVSGGVGSGATIGQAIVDAIKAYERTSGAVWVGA
jgi:hypothetical protein